MTTTMATKPKIAIDEELANLNPPLREWELAQLEENLLRDGCLDKLICWDIGVRLVLLDGHNRYRLCEKHDIPWDVYRMQFNSREEAVDWAHKHQRGRRNLPEELVKYRRGQQHGAATTAEESEESATQPALSHGATTPSTAASSHGATKRSPGGGATAKRVAKSHGVNRATVYRDAKYTRDIDAIAAVAPDLKSAILEGTTKLAVKDVAVLAKAGEETIREVERLVKDGDMVAAKAAVHARQPGDDTDLIKAEAAKRRNSGKETVSPKERKEAIRAFGVVVRHVTKLGKRGQCADHLEAIRLIVEGKL